jgi:hypothetical protein
VMTGDDGHEFDNMFCLQGEVPPMRYKGRYKVWGPQYIRGIMPGNGNPPGNHLWNVYSMNKEDIWVTRTRVPVTGRVDEYVSEDFEKAETEADLELWNLYVPKWAPISVVSGPVKSGNKCLELRDKDRYDYGLAERVFPESKRVTIKFDVLAGQTKNGRMDIDVVNKNGVRGVCITLRRGGKIHAVSGNSRVKLPPYEADRWLSFRIDADAAAGKFTVFVNGKEVLTDAEFAEKTETVKRLVFRTGKYRRRVGSKPGKKDLPKADTAVKEAVYCIDNVSITP